MVKFKKGLMVFAFAASTVLLSGCKVGTSSLFVHPSEQGYEYEVVYDTLGGHINQVEKRSVFYAEDSLLYEPSGTAGMLVQPKNGERTLYGWYTKCSEEQTSNGITYKFNDDDLWNFETDRVSEQTAPDHKITLYARWVDNPEIKFVDAQNSEDVLLKWTIGIGKILQKPTSSEPKKSGFTLIDYYTDPECTQKYVFGHELTEETVSYTEDGKAYINIYCKFKEGSFTRIKTVTDLKAIADNPAQEYILAQDIDMAGVEWTPIEGFSGKLDGNGYSINNLEVAVSYKLSKLAAMKAEEKSYGLFTKLDGAVIEDLSMKNTQIMIDPKSNVKVCVGALAGRTSKTTISNCKMIDTKIISANATIDITAARIAATDSSCKLLNNEVDNFDTSQLLTTGNLEIVE